MSALRSLPLLSLAVAASCALVGGRDAKEPPRARAAERTAPAASYDLVAIDTWAQLHLDAVELAQLAARRSTSEEIRTYAQRSILEANGDRESLSAWRVDWFGDAPRALSATLPGVRFAARSVDAAALDRAAPEDFDRVYLEMRIPLVEAEAALARDVAAKATHEELRGLARMAIDEDAEELATLRALYGRVVDQR